MANYGIPRLKASKPHPLPNNKLQQLLNWGYWSFLSTAEVDQRCADITQRFSAMCCYYPKVDKKYADTTTKYTNAVMISPQV